MLLHIQYLLFYTCCTVVMVIVQTHSGGYRGHRADTFRWVGVNIFFRNYILLTLNFTFKVRFYYVAYSFASIFVVVSSFNSYSYIIHL
jgi:hypothetical protein